MTNAAWLDELEIEDGDHIIAIVTEGRDVDLLGPYYRPACDAGHPCVAVATPTIASELGERLGEAGLGEDAVEFHNPLETGIGDDGRFDVERFLSRAGDLLAAHFDLGAKAIRHAGVMRWLNEARVDERDQIYLEARINEIVEGSPTSCLCVYDARQIGAHLLVQLLRTHPKVLLDRRVVQNPFYVKPQEVIRELRGS
ncbi:MAG: MEDS domain-containing protein [Planctomycetota bacterium]